MASTFVRRILGVKPVREHTHDSKVYVKFLDAIIYAGLGYAISLGMPVEYAFASIGALYILSALIGLADGDE